MLIFTVLIMMAGGGMFAQVSTFRADKKKAEDAFRKKDYSTALLHYTALAERYKADPLYKYYSAICYINSGAEMNGVVSLLEEAISNSLALRTVPDDVWYYLGRANHLSGNYDMAINAYDKFRELAKRKEIKSLRIDELIEECNSWSGMPEIIYPVEEEVVQDIPVNVDVIILMEQELTLPVSDTVIIETDRSYDIIAREALEFQFKADSTGRLADGYRKSLSKLTGPDRETIKAKIISLEEIIFENQALADKKYREAAILAAELYNDESDSGLLMIEETVQMAKQTAEEEVVLVADTVITTPNDSIAIDTSKVEVVAYVPVLNVFSDETDQPDIIPVNPEMPDGLYYRIQTAAFRNPVKPEFFKTLGPVFGFKVDNSGITYYFIGQFRVKSEADKAKVRVRQSGFNDAFVLAIMDGKRVSLERAEVLERDWAEISLFDSLSTPIQTTNKVVKPEEPPTLVYRVEIMKLKKKAANDELEIIQKLAGERSFNIYETADEEYVYLIGKFLTFESASTYADLLFRNGLKDSKVAAYLGKKEIPLETARQLFEMYFEK